MTWVAGVERSEPPEMRMLWARCSTTATLTSSTYFFADAQYINLVRNLIFSPLLTLRTVKSMVGGELRTVST